jgi:hypothetical protein
MAPPKSWQLRDEGDLFRLATLSQAHRNDRPKDRDA